MPKPRGCSYFAKLATENSHLLTRQTQEELITPVLGTGSSYTSLMAPSPFLKSLLCVCVRLKAFQKASALINTVFLLEIVTFARYQ